MQNKHKKLVTATAFVPLGIPRGSVYRMAKCGLIPYYKAGARGRGLRFDLDEVMAVLHQPAASTVVTKG